MKKQKSDGQRLFDVFVEEFDKPKIPECDYWTIGFEGELCASKTYKEAIENGNRFFKNGYIVVKIVEDKYILLYGG